MDVIKRNKVNLIGLLHKNTLVLQHAFAQGIITNTQHDHLRKITDDDERNTQLIDIIVLKGAEACQDFFRILAKDEVNKLSPGLRKWLSNVDTSSISAPSKAPVWATLPHQQSGIFGTVPPSFVSPLPTVPAHLRTAWEAVHSPPRNRTGPRSFCASCTVLQDTTEWIIIVPETETTGHYKVSSPGGSYECSISGLRWVCDSDVSLKYHYSDWELYREQLRSMQVEPCGPLMDITVMSGVLKEVHLPHVACSVLSPDSLKDEVRVLDVQEGGMLLEMCELTPFHAKLLNPTFSPKGLLIRSGFPVKVHCEVLIYQTLYAHLTLHVYLVICDQNIIQQVENNEKAAVKISKPGPERSQPMKSRYKIKTKRGDENFSSVIKPERLKLRYSPIKYCEVYICEAKDDFEMHLINEKEKSIWDVEIRAVEYLRHQHYSSMSKRRVPVISARGLKAGIYDSIVGTICTPVFFDRATSVDPEAHGSTSATSVDPEAHGSTSGTSRGPQTHASSGHLVNIPPNFYVSSSVGNQRSPGTSGDLQIHAALARPQDPHIYATASGTSGGPQIHASSGRFVNIVPHVWVAPPVGNQRIPDFEDFLKKHRSKLISNVKNVAEIADDLNLSNEMRSVMQAEPTDQAKMRKVLEYTNSTTGRALLINALWKHAGDIMYDLTGEA